MKNAVFANNQIMPGTHSNQYSIKVPWKGDNQPPKNISAVKADIKIILAYSAKKKAANAIPEYSIWKPATISDSPSATSNGARLVSATPEMKYTIISGNSGSQNQCRMLPDCAWT